MDKFSCSHRCTLDVRLGQGRVGAQTPVRPAFLGVLCLGILFVFLLLPLPQNRSALYCLSLAMPFSVQNLILVPATTRVDGAGTRFSRIHL
jgi:hypothetical protein